MAENSEPQAAPSEDAAPETQGLEGGAYEVLRTRMAAQGQDLRQRAEKLNVRRKELFGGQEIALVGSTRITTEHACVPRDLIQVGEKFIFGYEVRLGMKKETDIGDVFSVYRFDGKDPIPLGLDLLNDPAFEKDLKELFRYYRSARLLHLRNTGRLVLLAFQSGQRHTDLKVFRWELQPDGSMKYLDARGEKDYVFPPQHDFEWKRCTRDQHVAGRFPHITIDDLVFVECVGGDLTIKIEDNTESGQGIYAEPVDDPDQSLDDAEVSYVVMEHLVLLKVKPYNETETRYFVFNRLTRDVRRIDAIEQACLQLPEGHGIVYPGGCYLQTGEAREFDAEIEGMIFQKMLRSSNGEDALYIFYKPDQGRYLLLPYNLVDKKIANPIVCQGASRLPDGKFIVFRDEGGQPGRSHAVQIWQTPFTGEGHEPPVKEEGYLARIGNRDLVNGLSEIFSLARQTQEEQRTTAAFENLARTARRILDRFHWLENEECQQLDVPVKAVQETAVAALEEFEKARQIRRDTNQRIETADEELRDILQQTRSAAFARVEDFVKALSDLHTQRGHLITLRELRYADLPRLDKMEEELVALHDEIADRTVKYLQQDEALTPYTSQLEELFERIKPIKKTADLVPLQEELEGIGEGLDLLVNIVQDLKIDDPTIRTAILDALSEVLAHQNRVKAGLASRRQDIALQEGEAEFVAQIKLLGQNLANALALCDEPEKCDDGLARLLVQLENLEARFAESDEFVNKIADKREEVAQAFDTRKQSLLEARRRRGQTLIAAVERVLRGVERRAAGFNNPNDLNAFFASDPMVRKAREQLEQLRGLGEQVKADELDARLKGLRQEAGRTLRDRLDLFEEGAKIIRLGDRRFTVHTEALDLSLVPREEGLSFHLTGTDYFRPVKDETLDQARDFWTQNLPSENPEVYRAAYLAWKMLKAFEAGHLELPDKKTPAELLGPVRDFSQELYEEGYERGVHDQDAAALLAELIAARERCGSLRFSPASRALGLLYWSHAAKTPTGALLGRQAVSLGRIARPTENAVNALTQRLAAALTAFLKESGFPEDRFPVEDAANYVRTELGSGEGLSCSPDAAQQREALLLYLAANKHKETFLSDITALEGQLPAAYQLAMAWLNAYQVDSQDETDSSICEETAALLLAGDRIQVRVLESDANVPVEGLLGQHPVIREGKTAFRLDRFLGRMRRFHEDEVPRYRAYQVRKKEVLGAEKVRLRLDEFEARSLSTFVRNRLIDEVYLSLIGANLAKQVGEAGAEQQGDNQGMLLLISPPGYGKTTLMEYLAQRLGLVFMKVNGPALGHSVVSLDPDAAPDATSRQELGKLNLALEMGQNVMLYLDDIQHLNPEFLQKFISLCDAQRKIEGVFDGRARTYDLRGKRFMVVMAGNPYTESGSRFRIPDMLANRADTYNLGDILSGRQDLFELSYLENCATSNAALQPLTTRNDDALRKLLQTTEEQKTSELAGELGCSAAELKDVLGVLGKLRTVQKVVLRINQEYIRSAAQADEYRTEPPFKLQGSYRDMNKLASRVWPVTSDDELMRLIEDHYANEAQTLTSGAEQNLLKLGELLGSLDEQKKDRWEEIKRTYKRRQSLFGMDSEDKVSHIVAQLSSFNENLEGIGAAIAKATTGKPVKEAGADPGAVQIAAQLEQIGAALAKANAKKPDAEAGAGAAQIARQLEALTKTLARGKEDESKLGAALAKLGESLNITPKVEIVNTLPQHYAKLYKQQIDLIESVLVPVAKGLKEQLKLSEDNRLRVAEVVKELKYLNKQFETAPTRKGGHKQV